MLLSGDSVDVLDDPALADELDESELQAAIATVQTAATTKTANRFMDPPLPEDG
jgi:hypothetical protein